MTPADLAAARWFRAKHRAVATVTPIDSAAVGPADLVIVEVGYADGNGSDRYLLVTVHAREPEDGEGAWAAIVDAMARNATVPAVRGAFEARHTPALTRLLERPPKAERRLRVEQSNTSVRIGKRLLLKLYRLLEAGPNPDLELTAFLSEAGFADTPALAGWLTWRPDEGEPAAAAMLQSYVPSTGDAWAAMLEALARDPREGVALAGQLGQLTRRLHDALASRPSDVFPARTATVAETGAWRASAERQLAQAVSAVAGDAHRDLVALAPNVRARFADTFGSSQGEARVSRIHGDLHLGQLLARADGGFAVIDFEGEPARPLAERREPGSPLRDVAGMLRSLDYAARTAERAPGGLDAEDWLADARAAFLAGYGEIGPTGGSLLEAFELEKACYEVRYEAGNRPEWLWLPLEAVQRLTRAT